MWTVPVHTSYLGVAWSAFGLHHVLGTGQILRCLNCHTRSPPPHPPPHPVLFISARHFLHKCRNPLPVAYETCTLKRLLRILRNIRVDSTQRHTFTVSPFGSNFHSLLSVVHRSYNWFARFRSAKKRRRRKKKKKKKKTKRLFVQQ